MTLLVYQRPAKGVEGVATLHVFTLHTSRYWSYELERKRRGQKARLWMVIAKTAWWRTLLQTFLTVLEVRGRERGR